MPAFVRAQGSRRALKVSIGRIPWAAGNSPMTQYMINNKLLEKRAAEYGYDLTLYTRHCTDTAQRDQIHAVAELLGVAPYDDTD